ARSGGSPSKSPSNMERFIARRLMKDVAVADLVRRSFVVAPRLLAGAFVPLLALWILPTAGACAAAATFDAPGVSLEMQFVIGEVGFSAMAAPPAAVLGAVVRARVAPAGGGGKAAGSGGAPGGFPGRPRAFSRSLSAGGAAVAGRVSAFLPGFFVDAVLF